MGDPLPPEHYDTTQWATHKFTAIVRGTEVTRELWLPEHLTYQDGDGICEGLRELVK